MCAPNFPDHAEAEPEQVQEAQVHVDIMEVLNAILRIIAENELEASDSDNEDDAVIVPQAPIQSASGSLDGAPPPKRPRDEEGSSH